MEKFVIEHFKERIQRGEYIDERKTKLPPRGVFVEGRLLEVGCGARLTYFPQKLEVYCIDITPEMIKLFKKSYPNFHAMISDVKMLPFKKKSFDIIVSNMLLHHLVGSKPTKCRDNINDSIREMKRILKSGGIILINEHLVRNYIFSIITFYATLISAKLGIENNSVDTHSKVITFFLSEKEFKKILLENGFEIEEIRSKEWKMPYSSNLPKIKLGRTVELLLKSSQSMPN